MRPGGFPHLRDGTLEVLGGAASMRRESLRRAAVGTRRRCEDALAARGICGAMVRTAAEWRAHSQGRALEPLPAVEVIRIGDAPPRPLPRGDRPLAGVRALDLTRILAGPACGRALAGHGADVLLVSSPQLPSILPFVIDTSHGKRSAFLDLDEPQDAAMLRELIRGADVFAQGYRGGAMERRGLGPDAVARLRPGIVYVSINCYGHIGPWRERPGWEQLAQTVAGIAAVQGVTAEAAAHPRRRVRLHDRLSRRVRRRCSRSAHAHDRGSWHVRASLCQTAMWFAPPHVEPASRDWHRRHRSVRTTTDTPFGRLTHLAPVRADVRDAASLGPADTRSVLTRRSGRRELREPLRASRGDGREHGCRGDLRVTG